ncbi:outer membrane protein with beta-barrel domain [Luteibacter rhizovicinus]|uniref:Outer membrane protein with beta-barrel domain n=1 Tax=Luteibacter rhizovicinus TaxID=242606 RepID=A0A4R3YND7_9GAMM|nr:outer membrane beta-barrel protein [Luteibacter rhizovicinus]TCV92383.1 outer membrane protein with beta-barrel domain [Luteibacter rhizovicinus]
MQKVLLSVAAAAALSFASFGAHAASQGAFVNASVGSSRYDTSGDDFFQDKTDTAYGIAIGYRWAVDAPFYLGVEGGYANLGKMTGRYNYGQVGMTTSLKADTILIGGNAKWELPSSWFITARLGLAHSKSKLRADAYAGSATASDSVSSTDNGIYAGLGFGYDFTPNLGLAVTYDHYSMKAQHIIGTKQTVNSGVFGGTLEFRF